MPSLDGHLVEHGPDTSSTCLWIYYSPLTWGDIDQLFGFVDMCMLVTWSSNLRYVASFLRTVSSQFLDHFFDWLCSTTKAKRLGFLGFVDSVESIFSMCLRSSCSWECCQLSHKSAPAGSCVLRGGALIILNIYFFKGPVSRT